MTGALHPTASSSLTSAFGWVEVGVGAAAMLGLVLLATGLVAGALWANKRFVPNQAKEEVHD